MIPELRVLPEQFSSPLLGKAFGLLLACYRQQRPVSLSSLQGEFGPEEMSHLSALTERYRSLVSDQAVQDCTRVICTEYEKSLRTGEDGLLAMQARLQEKKGYGG